MTMKEGPEHAPTHNVYYVHVQGGLLFIGTQPGGMNREQALNLAAHLIAMSRVLPGTAELKDVIEPTSREGAYLA